MLENFVLPEQQIASHEEFCFLKLDYSPRLLKVQSLTSFQGRNWERGGGASVAGAPGCRVQVAAKWVAKCIF
jgi:hypothetical protein